MNMKQGVETELLYNCPSCQVSVEIAEDFVGDTVDCPNCSVPFHAETPSAEPILDQSQRRDASFSISTPTDDESVLESIHPALVRRNPVQFLGLTALGIASIWGAVTAGQYDYWILTYLCVGVFLIGAGYAAYLWVDVLMTTLIITSKRTRKRTGIIEKRTSEVQHDDVRNLQVNQNMLQRILGIGDIAISSSGQDDLEIVVQGIPSPNDVAETVRRMQ